MYEYTQKGLEQAPRKISLDDMTFEFCTKTFECSQFLPEHLREDFLKQSSILGGSVWSYIHNLHINDYDFFLETEELANKINVYFKETLFKETENRIKQLKEENKFNLFSDVHIYNDTEEEIKYFYEGILYQITPNAVTIYDKEDNVFQIITKWFGDAEKVMNEFDFCNVMVGYVKGKIQTTAFYDVPLCDDLIYNTGNTRSPLQTLSRVAKYTKKGLSISVQQMNCIIRKLIEKGITEEDIKEFERNSY